MWTFIHLFETLCAAGSSFSCFKTKKIRFSSVFVIIGNLLPHAKPSSFRPLGAGGAFILFCGYSLLFFSFSSSGGTNKGGKN